MVHEKNEKTAHLVWCALIALRLARQDGRVRSEQQENLFLIRWFADAERQRRFSRDVATDIRWILQQGLSPEGLRMWQTVDTGNSFTDIWQRRSM
ncbi:DUF2913 family protein [Salmonella enterica]|nr:DUF2913 family protein [Salmonella enterica]EJH1054735.1 DUF2913 family protein [Salmonella enterica]